MNFFVPMAPSPAKLVVGYRSSTGEHTLSVETSAGDYSAAPRACELTVIVVDRRDRKDRLGTVSGGFVGEIKAKVHTDDNVALWVQDAVSRELGILNFKVFDANLDGAGNCQDGT